MSLAAVEAFLVFAETTMSLASQLPVGVDPVELESALVSHGVVLLHSHMELCIRKAIQVRCSRCSDAEVAAFAQSVAEEKSGKLGLASLNQTLGRFGGTAKASFVKGVDANGLNAPWDSVVNHRKLVAHEGQPAQLTLKELRQYFTGVSKVLGLFCSSAGLSSGEVASISPLIKP